jgi:uncharacterized SAM-binding protein YcdF (DUF218 family)
VTRRVTWIGAAVAVGLLAFGAGFVIFARTVAGYVPGPVPRADAIVVLTGADLRLPAAAQLLQEGRGARLLISGVNTQTRPSDLKRLSGLPERLFAARVDIGYTAHSTSDNAAETRAWAKERGYTKLIVVTSSYHMPRSLLELRRTMPGVTLLPHPVVSNRVHAARWWMDAHTTRVLLGEYVRLLPSAARYGAARLLNWEESAVAGTGHSASG